MIKLIKPLSLVLLLLTFVRCGFLLYSDDAFFQDSELIYKTLFWGLRYDLATVIIVNLPLILFYKLMKLTIMKWYYAIVNGAILFMNLVDIPLFTFTNKRMTADLIYLFGDIWEQQLYLWKDYFWVPLLTALLIVLLLKIFVLLMKQKENNQLIDSYGLEKRFFIVDFFYWKNLLKIFVIISILVLGVRGGLQSKPLSVVHAQVLGSSLASSAAQNTVFSVLQSFYNGVPEKYHFFENREKVLEVLNPRHCSGALHSVAKKFNVVLLIVESLSREYMGWGNDYKGYTPFLDDLVKKSLFFPNTIANGQRSIEALPSILASMPHLLEKAFSTTSYMENNFLGLGQILKKQGYQTSFFHGGKNGTMYFDVTSARFGFKNYYGLNEYDKGKRDFDGAWGIFDEPFLQFSLEKMDQQKEPWASVIFTLSSHHPYKVPDKYQKKFLGGTLKIHKSLEYVDWALQKFFEKASQKDWYNRTLFVITADHAQKNSEPSYSSFLRKRLIPLYFYIPGLKEKQIVINKRVQQLDIPSSILDLLGQEVSGSPLAQSVFSDCYESRVIFSQNGAFWLVNEESSLKYDGQEFYFPDSNKDPVIENTLKASLQYFFNGLIDNNWQQ